VRTKVAEHSTSLEETWRQVVEDLLRLSEQPDSGIPESFKVLLKELQSLGLDVSILTEEGSEIELKENTSYGDTSFSSILEGDSRHYNEDSGFEKAGYTIHEQLKSQDSDMDSDSEEFESNEEFDETQDAYEFEDGEE